MGEKATELAGAIAEFAALGEGRVRRPDGLVVVELPAGVLESKPWLKWNAFMALLSHSGLDELHPSQQAAWRAQEYETEVQNGGHAQYLGVRGGTGLDEAVEALRLVGAPRHADVLSSAIEAWRTGSLGEEREGELDAAFGEIEPPLAEVLETYLEAHADQFVVGG